MRILLALAAVLVPGLAGATGLSSGPCPPSTYGPRRALDCLLDSRGSVRAVLYESADGATQEIALFEPGGPPRTLISERAYSFRDVSPLLLAHLDGPGSFEPSATPLPMNPPRPAPLGASTRVIERTYDSLDRIETETVPLENGGTATIAYSYYDDGKRRTVTDAFGRVTFYEYDGRGNLQRVTVNQGLPDQQVVSYTYWPDNLLRSITRPNGVVTSYDYDRADRLRSVVVRRGEALLLSHEYTYDANGNRLTQVETNGGAPETTSYTYDDLNRLTSVTYPDGTSASYAYDPVGNRVGEVLRDSSGVVTSSKTAVFDPINRLSSITDSVDPANDATLTYDANGNLRSKTTAAGTEYYDYDTRDQLVETRSGAAVSGRYAYDAFGRRYLKYGLEGLRQYLYDETSTLHELSETGLEVAKYEYGGSSLLSVARSDEPRRFHHQDALGSVVALSDSDGSVVARYHLDAWGRYRVPAELDASRNRFGFTGYLFDQETDLYYAKARFYDPEIGRFISQDSFLGNIDQPPSLHRYVYGWNRPTFYIDPSGHEVKPTGVDTTRITWDEFGRPIVGAVTAIETEPVEVKASLDRGNAVAADLDLQLARPMDELATRGMGAARVVGGGAQVAVGVAGLAVPEPTMVTKVAGGVAIAHGVDDIQAGVRQALTGEVTETLTGAAIRKGAEKAGATPEAAALISAGGEFFIAAGSTGLVARNMPAPQRITLGRVTPESQITAEVAVAYAPGPGIDRAEFARQLADQEAGLNRMTAGEIKARIEQFRSEGRPSSAAAAIREARSADPAAAQGRAALHNPDCCIGGNPEAIGGFGDKSVNSSLGSLNRARQGEIYNIVSSLPSDTKVQFRLVVEAPKRQ